MKRTRLATLLFVAISFFFASCGDPEPEIEPITIKDAYGLTPTQISEYWKTPVNEMDRSFDLLVSKNLHPYQPPSENKLLRFGDSYLILEFADGRLIAIHHVSG